MKVGGFFEKDFYEKPYWVVDILSEKVPEESAGQYFAINEYFLREPQVSVLRRKFANIILKLNCYYDMYVFDDPGDEIANSGDEIADSGDEIADSGDEIADSDDEGEEAAELNPPPGALADMFVGVYALGCVRIVIEEENALIVSNKDDTYMTIYNPTERLLGMIRRLAEAEGLFVWQP